MDIDIFATHTGVSRGLHDFRSNACWECEKRCATTSLSICSICKEASYCSRNCQVIAWRDGHKEQCAALPQLMCQFKECVREIPRRNPHKECNGVLHGIQLSFYADCDVPRAFLLYTIPMIGLLVEMLEGPSMDLFYSNLAGSCPPRRVVV